MTDLQYCKKKYSVQYLYCNLGLCIPIEYEKFITV